MLFCRRDESVPRTSLVSYLLLPKGKCRQLFVCISRAKNRHSDTCGVGWPRRYAFDVQHIRELRDVSSFMQIVVFYSFSRGESSISYLSPFASFTLPLLHSLQMLHGSFVCSLLVFIVHHFSLMQTSRRTFSISSFFTFDYILVIESALAR